MRQIFRIGKQPALVCRVLVKDVDALAQQFVNLAGQKMLEGLEGVDARLVDVVDRQILGVRDHDVDRHVVQHLVKAIGGKAVCFIGWRGRLRLVRVAGEDVASGASCNIHDFSNKVVG